ncbi:MAG: chromosomal replication initiator protein DnaA [Actinobacteria bacterium]|nr:chromosomal replication initiator protein DnaA [Actinomycetota bacterium]
MDHDQLWPKTCAVFRTEISEDVCDLWLGQLEPASFDGETLYLTGPERARSWVELRYGRLLAECASTARGADTSVRLVAENDVPGRPMPTGQRFSPVPGAPAGDPEFTPLNPRYTFDQFVIGVGNHAAHAAALAVAEQPAQAFNPLFIYGAPGVGKTHLLQSTGNYLRREAPELRVTYMTAENFAGLFRSVLRAGTISEFKQQLRDTDVLLIDDVQFLQNKTKTEEEFFHTFNALHEAGRQLVISCDRRPRELGALADRLLARFESGLVVEIEEPDLQLRTAILRKRARLDNIPIEDEAALERIAQRVPANVRSLEGALIRVSAFASLRRSPLTVDLVDELLDALHPRNETRRVTVADVQRAVSSHFDLPLDEILGPSRDRRLSNPRQLAMYLACELTGDSLPMIAAAFNRNHSTVVHARDKLAGACKSDSELAATADSLRRLIDSNSDRHVAG